MIENRGFTVPELLVVLALMSVVVLAAAQLVGEAVQLVDGAGRTMRSPSFTLAMATIRRDVQLAAGAVTSMTTGWSEDTLELLSWDGRRVRVFVDGDAIVRETVDEVGRSTGRRVLARGISSWWWRTPNPWTVDLRITAMVIPDPIPARRAIVVRRTETRRFVMRGSPGGRSW
jgi:prepilin-type N-terminal cleavage/methylation domain-containing protein